MVGATGDGDVKVRATGDSESVILTFSKLIQECEIGLSDVLMFPELAVLKLDISNVLHPMMPVEKARVLCR